MSVKSGNFVFEFSQGDWWWLCLRLEGTSRTNLIQASCSKQCQLQRVAEGRDQLNSEYLQGWRRQNLSVHLFQYYTCLTVKRELKFF